MRKVFRDFFRRRLVGRHVSRHGPVYSYHGVSVTVPFEAGLGACSALLRDKYEREEVAMISKYLPPDKPVIELGGSLGVVSALIRSKLDAETRHLVVEANPDIIHICATNAKASDEAGETIVINAAVYYDGPVARFHVGPEVHSNALGKSAGDGKDVIVEAVTLSQLHRMAGEPREFSLVSDIEGGEYAIFQQDAEVLQFISTIIMELHPAAYRRFGGSEGDLLEICARAGFELAERDGNVVSMMRH